LRLARQAHAPYAMIGCAAGAVCHALITLHSGKSLEQSSTEPHVPIPMKTAHPQIASVPRQEHKGTALTISVDGSCKEYMRHNRLCD
jgi:hypothetical protein